MSDASALFISNEEFAQMEVLLGRLLKDASEREAGLILNIHKRLKKIKDGQQSDKIVLDYLKNLAS